MHDCSVVSSKQTGIKIMQSSILYMYSVVHEDCSQLMTACYDIINLYLCMDPCNLGPPNKLFQFVGNHHRVFFGVNIQRESGGGDSYSKRW